MDNFFKIYGEVVDYAKYLENLLKEYSVLDDESLKEMRKKYIKPATNVAEHWVEED